MKIETKEDLENNILIIDVSVSPRKYSSQKRETFHQRHLQELLEAYTPPVGYTLGRQKKSSKIVDNSRKNRLIGQWIYQLNKDLVANELPTKNKKNKTTSATKPSKSKKSEE